MVLVVADDLLFRSKISAAAKTLGIEIGAARSPDAALERATAQRPALILLDLDGQATQPFEVLRRLRDDPALADVPTLGFVSHVHTEVIRQARALGIGEVMARGAFAASLGDILAPYAPRPTGAE